MREFLRTILAVAVVTVIFLTVVTLLAGCGESQHIIKAKDGRCYSRDDSHILGLRVNRDEWPVDCKTLKSVG